MKKQKKDIFIVGLALFGSYFGAGNLIFPPLLGFISGSQWSLAAIGFCVSAVLMPVVGLYVISKNGGSLEAMTEDIHKNFAKFLLLFIMLFAGNISVPRTGAVAYELGFKALFPGVPIIVFIIALLMAFKVDVFNSGLWENAFASNDLPSSINGQIGTAMSSTIWVYVGIEGALIYSARAKSKSDASKAIVISYIVIAVTYLLLTFLTFGVLSQVQVSKMEVPALGGILEAVVGKWGAILMNLGIALSAMGCWFGCCLFAGEILDVAAKHEIVPKFFGVENTVGQPTNSLLVSTIIQQAFFITIIINESIYNVMALFASSTMLVPYFTVSLTMIKKSIKFDNGFKLNALLGCISTIAMGYLMYSTGWKYIIITALLFAPCMIVYYLARKENNKKFLTNIEKIIALVIVALAIISLVLIFNGTIDLSTM